MIINLIKFHYYARPECCHKSGANMQKSRFSSFIDSHVYRLLILFQSIIEK